MTLLVKVLTVIGLAIVFVIVIKVLVFVVFFSVVGITLAFDRYRGRRSQWLIRLIEWMVGRQRRRM